MQNINTISFSETRLKTLNATWNANQNTMLLNTKNYMMNINLVKMSNTTQNIVVEYAHRRGSYFSGFIMLRGENEEGFGWINLHFPHHSHYYRAGVSTFSPFFVLNFMSYVYYMFSF